MSVQPDNTTLITACGAEESDAFSPESVVQQAIELRDKLKAMATARSSGLRAAPQPDSSPVSPPSPARPVPSPKELQSVPYTPGSESVAHGSRMATLSSQIKSSVIMVVDDEELNILTVCNYLKKEGYHSFVPTTDSREALKLIREKKPDCLLLDIKMPNVSGLDILRTKAFDPTLEQIPTIILTASTDPHVKKQALDLGAADFLTKPVDPNELIPRVRNVLLVRSHISHVEDEAARLEDLVRRRTAELYQSRQQLILSLARAAEHRDNETSNHVIRVGRYAGLIARELGWCEDKAQMLEQAAQLHDVGKIGIPDAILFKPGTLEPQEFEFIKKHCAIGKEIIEPLSEREFEIFKSHTRLGADIVHMRSSPMLLMASRIAQTHHERWDGTGYPLGLAGTDIPIEGRITSVADVYDALSTERPYKKAFPRPKCFEILEEGRGTQFDAQVLDAFFTRSKEIIEVQMKFMDRYTPAVART